MARVVLLVTGSMEERAFADSLRRLFPDHDFVAKPRLDGFTSAPLPPVYDRLRLQRSLLNLEKFARTIIGSFAPGGRMDRPRADFVLALEDVELHNDREPGNITRRCVTPSRTILTPGQWMAPRRAAHARTCAPAVRST